jgi:hypothetical protein
MADALVELLNREGYQPFSIPRTNVDAPDVLTVVNKEMRFWGRLHKFYDTNDGTPIPEVAPTAGRSPDIELQHTTRKKLGLATSCLQSLLKCIGLTSFPKIDLSFCGDASLTFRVSGVTYRRVDPVDLNPFLQRFSQRNIPDEYVDEGAVHTTYEYLYAERLLMQLSSGQELQAELSGSIGDYIDLGTQGDVAVRDRSTLEFTSKNGDAVAFAFRSGRLERAGNKWTLYIHESALGRETHEQRLWVPARGELLRAANDIEVNRVGS